MEVENSAGDGDSSLVKENENEDAAAVNGVNGYSDKHKAEHKNKDREKDRDKHRDKERDKDKHRDKERDRNKDRDRDKDRHRSKDHKSSSSKDKERERDKDKHSSSRDKDRHSSSHKSSSKDKDKERDKDKHRDKDRHRDDKKSSSSSSKDKDKEHKSSRDKDRDHKSSSSSSKDKEKDRDKDRKDRDKDREREKDKERSKDKDKDKKHSSSSSSKDKHRDKDKDRHHSSSSKESKDKDRKDRDKEKEKQEKKSDDDTKHKLKQESVKEESFEQPQIKYEDAASTDDDEDKLVIKDEPSSQDEADLIDTNNLSQASSCDYNLSHFDKNETAFECSEGEAEMNDPGASMDDSQDCDYKPVKEEPEDSDDEDIPLAARMTHNKRKIEDDEEDDDDDDMPLMARKKVKKEEDRKKKKKKRMDSDYEEEDDDFKPQNKKKVKKEKKTKVKQEVKQEESPKKGGRKKKEEEPEEVWKWWEEEKKEDGVKWNFLEHKGPVFAPPYEPLPSNVKFYYNGTEIKLSQDAEEIAGFYAKMLDHDYTTKDAFNKNFFHDWREAMTREEKETITDLKRCNFKQMHAYFMDLAEKNRNRTKEEKQALKEKNEALLKEYGFCKIDGHKEKIGNFKIEPPGLFRGRGEHPKMGKLKKRLQAEDIIINCSKDSKIPEPPPGHKWREVRHDNKVTWLASWTENVQNQVKYIMLNPSSKLKGEKDWQKYETARKLHQKVNKIRENYERDWKSKEMKVRQRAVALYFIDKLALRAGNEKDEDQADTVGCCSLRVEHIQLHTRDKKGVKEEKREKEDKDEKEEKEEKDQKEYVVVFDFLGKDSIRYYNEVPVEKRVYKNLQLFMENKKEGDDLFDRLNTTIMNQHLNSLMEGLTAKVFRTYNASWTLQQQLDLLTDNDDTVAEKILSYNRANRAVAILCNHQRSVPKGHEKSMEKLKEKIETKREQIKDAERQVKDAQKEAKRGSVKEKMVYDKKKKILERLRDQLVKLEIQETDRDENKTIALGTSKLNYLDPRISVAWCKKYDVPIEKIYNKTQRDKFRWAIDMAGPDYRFDKL